MGLRELHENFLAKTIESRDHYGQDVLFNLSDPGLEWHADQAGTVVPDFTLGGIVNIVSQQSDTPGVAAGVSTQRANAVVRLSSLLAECGGVPAYGLQITVGTRQGNRTFVVEEGQTHVDDQQGLVHYYLTDLTSVA